MNIAISIAVALLMHAALDDIATGRDFGHAAQWTAVASGSIWFIGIALARSRK